MGIAVLVAKYMSVSTDENLKRSVMEEMFMHMGDDDDDDELPPLQAQNQHVD